MSLSTPTIRWPEIVLPPGSQQFNLAHRTISGPSSVSGTGQVVSSGAGIWTASFGEIHLHTKAKHLTWDALQAMLEGRANPILVPFIFSNCCHSAPFPEGVTGSDISVSIPHNDNQYFSDGSGYVNGGFIEVTTATALSAGATSMLLTIGDAGEIEPGMHFSIGERMYRVKSATYASETTVTITFLPPLREAVITGASLDFETPHCKMRLISDAEMNKVWKPGCYSLVGLSFIEYF